MNGRRIGGRYEVIKYIGGGGMSKVYLAHDVILDRDVAIKILNYDFSNEEELKRRFMREALSATSLTHPHIVDIFDVGEEGELHYLVMEYIEGQTLKEFIQRNGAQSPEQVIPIMRQLVSAISNAHYNGIIHRDIKPQNILMDVDGNVKITDFGIAMALSATAHTKTNSVLGTVHYLSPEQARGGMATMKSDIYSLGIVFYELLTGKLPFSGESAVSIALKHLQEETPYVKDSFPSIPQSVENVILKATAKDAANRYRSADEMEEDLATVLLPNRMNEEKFRIPFDDDQTRAIPAITNSDRFENLAETKKHESVQPEPQVLPTVKKKKKWPIILGILSGVFIVALLLLLLLPSLLGPKKIEIHDVIGMEEEKAVQILEEQGFFIGDRFEEPSDEFEAGEVIRTDPEVRKKKEVGSDIALFISTGKEMIELEDYFGSDFTQTARLLANLGYKSIHPPEEVFSDEPVGTIIGQEPPKGTMVVPSETDLIFKVSKGPEVRTLKNLEGYTEKELEEYEDESGLVITILRKEHSETVPEGQVISQQPVHDTEIAKGGNVSVVLSLGPEKKPMKQIMLDVQIEYIPEMVEPGDEEDEDEGNEVEPERKPQTIRIYVQDRNRTMADLYEEFTITENTVKRITIELEEGQRGAYKIMRDSMLVEEEIFNYNDAD